jgi:nucleotide-binding universal stress UspA family protein
VFSTIITGTDGSKNAEEALQATAELASQNPGTDVHVVTAYRPLSAMELRDLAAQLPDEFHSVLTAHSGAEEKITKARTIFSLADVDATYHQIADDPTDTLLETAERFSADLIVVGSRREGAAKRALHGSVSTKILHHAPCAVLIIKDKT